MVWALFGELFRGRREAEEPELPMKIGEGYREGPSDMR